MGAHRPMGRCRGSAADRDGGDRGSQGRQGRGIRRLSPAVAWRWCALAGLATLAVSLGFPRIPLCGPTGGAGAIVALELVRSAADLQTLFGSPPCSDRHAAAQTAALWWDMLAFIPAYAAFLALAALALKPAQRRLALAAMSVLLLAALLDELEGVILFDLIRSRASPIDALFDLLFWTVRPKFALLSLGELLLAALLVRGAWPARIAAVPVAGGALLSLTLLFANPRAPLMMAGHRYAWTALLIVALLAAVRPALVARPEPV